MAYLDGLGRLLTLAHVFLRLLDTTQGAGEGSGPRQPLAGTFSGSQHFVKKRECTLTLRMEMYTLWMESCGLPSGIDMCEPQEWDGVVWGCVYLEHLLLLLLLLHVGLRELGLRVVDQPVHQLVQHLYVIKKTNLSEPSTCVFRHNN